MGMGAVVMMGVGAGMSAGAASSAGRYNKKIADQNAYVAELQAADALDRGREDENLMRERIRSAIGSSRVAYASQGVDVAIGSAVDLQAAIASAGEKDALTIRNNAAREAWGYRVQAVNQRSQGKLAQFQGDMQAANTVLGGFSNFMKGRK